MLDGEVSLTNENGSVEVASGQQAVVEPGQRPTVTAVIAVELAGVVQWCLYYPAVLHLDELGLDADERAALSDSIAAYRDGDLLTALSKYPEARAPGSAQERIYRAELLLAVGLVDRAAALLNTPDDVGRQSPAPVAPRILREALLRLP